MKNNIDKIKSIRNRIIQVVVLLIFWGTLSVYSASDILIYQMSEPETEYYLLSQFFIITIGFILSFFVYSVPIKYWYLWSKVILVFILVILCYTYFFGQHINYAKRWLIVDFYFARFTMQPSEFGRIVLIVCLAKLLSNYHQQEKKQQRNIVIEAIFWSFAFSSLVVMSDISSAIIFLITCFLFFIVSYVKRKYIFIFIFSTIWIAILAYFFSDRIETGLNRYISFFSSQNDQIRVAYSAINNGGLFGTFAGKGDFKNVLRNSESDFIFAILIEEYGLAGIICLLFFYFILIYNLYLLLVRIENIYFNLIIAGIIFNLSIQIIVHIMVNLNMIPITGLPLPFLSKGGTALVVNLFSIAMVLKIIKVRIQELSARGNTTYDIRN